MPHRHDYKTVDIAARLLADRCLHRDICSALETLADSLPAIRNYTLLRTLTDIMTPSAVEHTAFQEQVVFPIMRRHHAARSDVFAHIEMLERQHQRLTGLAQETDEQLRLTLAGKEPDGALLGYMFRNAFQEWRCHLESEEILFETTLPLALAPVDRLRVETWLNERPLPVLTSDGGSPRSS